MKAHILNAFLDAALHTLTAETKASVWRAGLLMDPTEHSPDEVSVYVALVGHIRGMVMIGMSTPIARELSGSMTGESTQEMTEMGLSALAELGNLIAGRATMEMERIGIPSDITPPTIMIGGRSRISTLGLPRFVIPLHTIHGMLHLHIAVDAGAHIV